tara:strand:- start:433 stop:552 length:120 start_codon:yes stop_codon:yes gene_type:complete
LVLEEVNLALEQTQYFHLLLLLVAVREDLADQTVVEMME